MEARAEILTAEKEAAESAKERQENATVIDFKMVTFSLAGKDYGINIMHVKEIAKAGRFTYVPNTLGFVLGVYNLRGEIIPILDLRLFFNIEVPPRDENKLENLLILEIDEQKFGVVVDKIDKVVGVQKSTIQPPHPLFGDINIKYINGVVESHNRLYVLLDVTRIFSTKDTQELADRKAAYNPPVQKSVENKAEGAVSNTANASQNKSAGAAAVTSAPKVDAVEEKENVDLKFITEGLANYKKFYVSSVNESWVKHRYTEWAKLKGEGKTQILNEADAEEFLKPFWSKATGDWWTSDYADSVAEILPENTAKQIVVWNPGCGKGTETYSLVCVLKKKYPDAKIRVYAQDIDLLNVSNAALMSVPASLGSTWYSSYLTQKANGDYTFNQEVKDSIMFEYHDCKNTNALPMVDIIFARDIISLLDEKSQDSVVADFLEKMKGNACVILGENETMPSSFRFNESSNGTLVAYTKD